MSEPDTCHESLRRELLRLARCEQAIAAREAERVQYWENLPDTVAIHRRCAAVLRAAADELLVHSRAPDRWG